MKSFILFTLIIASVSVFATGTLEQCQGEADTKPKECNQRASEARGQSDAAAAQALASCPKNAINQCAADNKTANDLSKQIYSNALARCESLQKNCEDRCTPTANEKPENKQKMKKLKENCTKQITKTKEELKKGGEGNQKGSDGSEKTGDQSKSGAPPAGAPPTPPKSDDDKEKEKTDATQQPAATQPTAEQKKPEEDKKGKAGLDDAKDQSAGGACSGGKFMCAGCPGFIQKCPGGNASSCMSKWSDGDRKNYEASCGGGVGDASTQALTNPKTPQSLSGASPQSAGGGGGGAGSTVSGGNNTSAMLDDGKKNATEDRAGHKEGGSMGVESAGGGGGGGGDSFGSNPFGSDDTSHGLGLAGMKGMSSSLANAFNASHDSRLAPGVLDRTGPNLFSIQESVFQERCNRNLLYHCPNKK